MIHTLGGESDTFPEIDVPPGHLSDSFQNSYANQDSNIYND
jgi:hypothetical protein